MSQQQAAKGLSFGFSKVSQSKKKPLTNEANFFQTNEVADQEVDYVKEVDGKRIKGSIKKKETKELVIPCQANKIGYRDSLITKQNEKNRKEEELKKDIVVVVGNEADDFDVRAAEELLKETQKWKEDRENESEDKREPVEIPLAEDLESRAEVSTLDDYESVPVNGFGLGMLRGMGFKPGEGIGGFKKADVKCIEPTLRPKGLGLGASRPKNGAGNGNETGEAVAKDEEGRELSLKKDAHVQITSGSHKELYGRVDGMDEDSARVFVHLAVGGKTVSVSENSLKLVSKKEYQKYAKIINRNMYDKYEEKQKIKQKEWDDGKESRVLTNGSSSEKSRKRTHDDTAQGDKSQFSNSKQAKKYSEVSRNWIRPGLKVRIVDDRYKSGKYFNSKVIIEDVVTAKSCTCRTEDGRYLEDLNPKYLETIVPKNEGSIVMILSGDNVGKLGEIIKRDKKQCLAVVHLLPDRDELLKLDFDDICEYKGELLEY